MSDSPSARPKITPEFLAKTLSFVNKTLIGNLNMPLLVEGGGYVLEAANSLAKFSDRTIAPAKAAKALDAKATTTLLAASEVDFSRTLTPGNSKSGKSTDNSLSV